MEYQIGKRFKRAFWRRMPERMRASHYLRQTDRSYELDIRAAKRKGDYKKAEDLDRERAEIRRDDQYEVDRLETLWWCKRAAHYHVPLPPRSDTTAWERDQFRSTSCLTSAGIYEIDKLIREKQKWRQDRWIAWIGVFVNLVLATAGLVGALIGLASIWDGAIRILQNDPLSQTAVFKTPHRNSTVRSQPY
jgi:hypothetical protein